MVIFLSTDRSIFIVQESQQSQREAEKTGKINRSYLCAAWLMLFIVDGDEFMTERFFLFARS